MPEIVASGVRPVRTRDIAKRVGIGLGLLAVVLIIARTAGPYIPRFAAWVDGLGAWGPVVFMAGYIVAAVAMVPGSLFSLAGGALFGLVRGTIYVFAGGTLGALAAFLVSRHVARGIVARYLGTNPRFLAIDRAIGQQGFKITFLLRLTPVMPFNVVNYGLGLTSVRFLDYAVASVGMLPAIVLYVYYGKLAGDVASLAGGAAVPRTTGYYVMLVIGLAATITVSTVITRVARKALRDATGEP